MPLETGEFITDLVSTNPLGTDPKSQGDDHLRLLKKVVQQSFPNIDEAVLNAPAVINTWEARITALEGAGTVSTNYQYKGVFEENAGSDYTGITENSPEIARQLTALDINFTRQSASGSVVLTVSFKVGNSLTDGVVQLDIKRDGVNIAQAQGQTTAQPNYITFMGAEYLDVGAPVGVAVVYSVHAFVNTGVGIIYGAVGGYSAVSIEEKD